MSKPPSGRRKVVVTLQIDVDLLDQVDALRDVIGRSRQGIVADALRDYLARPPQHTRARTER